MISGDWRLWVQGSAVLGFGIGVCSFSELVDLSPFCLICFHFGCLVSIFVDFFIFFVDLSSF